MNKISDLMHAPLVDAKAVYDNTEGEDTYDRACAAAQKAHQAAYARALKDQEAAIKAADDAYNDAMQRASEAFNDSRLRLRMRERNS